MSVVPVSSSARAVALYAVGVFISSAILLALEMVAARLIAPYVGVSLYTWSAVIGVILAGLSIGNTVGGIWADRGAGHDAGGAMLVASGLASWAVLPLLYWLAPSIQQSGLSLFNASLLLVLSLFLLPALLIGVVTPLLTTLALHVSTRTGHVVGLMHALAAIGSIVGTFAAAWWLIPELGSRKLVMISGTVLILLGLPFFASHRTRLGAVAVGLIALLGFQLAPQISATPCDRESSYFCLRVVPESRDAQGNEVRSLVLDHLLHGSNHPTEPERLLAPYVHLMEVLVRKHHQGRERLDAFFIGGGAYTQPRAYKAANPANRVIVAELDPVVTEIARNRLYLDTSGMEILHTDARAALHRQTEASLDVVVGDAFHDIAVPHHLITHEFAQLVRSRLRTDGIYVLNLIDIYPDGRFAAALLNTLRSVFPKVTVWLKELPTYPSRVTYVFAAGVTVPDTPRVSAGGWPPRRWTQVTAQVERDEAELLTDDRAPVERLIARLFVDDLGR